MKNTYSGLCTPPNSLRVLFASQYTPNASDPLEAQEAIGRKVDQLLEEAAERVKQFPPKTADELLELQYWILAKYKLPNNTAFDDFLAIIKQQNDFRAWDTNSEDENPRVNQDFSTVFSNSVKGHPNRLLINFLVCNQFYQFQKKNSPYFSIDVNLGSFCNRANHYLGLSLIFDETRKDKCIAYLDFAENSNTVFYHLFHLIGGAQANEKCAVLYSLYTQLLNIIFPAAPLNTPAEQDKQLHAIFLLSFLIGSNAPMYHPPDSTHYWGGGALVFGMIFQLLLITTGFKPVRMNFCNLMEIALLHCYSSPLEEDWQKPVELYRDAVNGETNELFHPQSENEIQSLVIFLKTLSSQDYSALSLKPDESYHYPNETALHCTYLLLHFLQFDSLQKKENILLLFRELLKSTDQALHWLLHSDHHFSDKEKAIIIALTLHRPAQWNMLLHSPTFHDACKEKLPRKRQREAEKPSPILYYEDFLTGFIKGDDPTSGLCSPPQSLRPLFANAYGENPLSEQNKLAEKNDRILSEALLRFKEQSCHLAHHFLDLLHWILAKYKLPENTDFDEFLALIKVQNNFHKIGVAFDDESETKLTALSQASADSSDYALGFSTDFVESRIQINFLVVTDFFSYSQKSCSNYLAVYLHDFCQRAERFLGIPLNFGCAPNLLIASLQADFDNIGGIRHSYHHLGTGRANLGCPELLSLYQQLLDIIFPQTPSTLFHSETKKLHAIFLLTFLVGSNAIIHLPTPESVTGGAFVTDCILQILLIVAGFFPLRKNYLNLTEVALLHFYQSARKEDYKMPARLYLSASRREETNSLFDPQCCNEAKNMLNFLTTLGQANRTWLTPSIEEQILTLNTFIILIYLQLPTLQNKANLSHFYDALRQGDKPAMDFLLTLSYTPEENCLLAEFLKFKESLEQEISDGESAATPVTTNYSVRLFQSHQDDLISLHHTNNPTGFFHPSNVL